MGSTEFFYSGKKYSLDPVTPSPMGAPTGYHPNFASLGSAVDARTANQLKEVSEHLNTGIRNIEVGAVQPDVFESIPEQHFTEMRRAAKLAGAELTFHAPMIDPTGITEQGWNKLAQDSAEKQLWDAIKKSANLNPNGTLVTFHASSVPLPGSAIKIMEGGEEKTKSVIIINSADGKINQIKEEQRYFDSAEGKKLMPFNPTEEIARLNEDVWMQKVSQLNFYARQGGEIVEHGIRSQGAALEMEKAPKPEEGHKEFEEIDRMKEMAARDLNAGKVYLRDSYRNLRELYDDVYKKATPEQKEKLENYAKEVKPFLAAGKYEALEQNPEDLKKFAKVIEQGVKIMGNMRPELFKPIREFAIEKAAETVSNLALKSYNEFGAKGKASPVIAIENHPANQSILTTGKDLREVIEAAQKNFIDKATKQGMSESQARKEAEKLIGATWDVGHINMLRRYGYGEEEIVKQTGEVAKHIKKIHLADNFGFEHTELPMGMGNVPMEKIMQKIGKEGYDIKKVIEAGNWWQHFSGNSKAGNPLMSTLYGMSPAAYGNAGPMGSPAYGTMGGYFAGYGTMLPEMNFQTYGAGFSTLPTELGGQMTNKDSRFSGTPMA